MKKITLSLVILFVAVGASAQSLIRNEQLPIFTSVALTGNMNVELIPGENNWIDVELFNSEVNRFTWSVSDDGTLTVKLRPTVGEKARADVRIYYKGPLYGISVNDAKLTAEGIVASIFKLSVSGGGNASVVLDADDAEIDVSAKSALSATGRAKYLALRVSEASTADTRGLEAVSAEVEAATGGEIYVRATERIVVKARTASNIYYSGNPSIVKNNTSKTSMGSGVYDIGAKK